MRVAGAERHAWRAVLAVLAVDSLASAMFVPLSLLYLVGRTGSSLAVVTTLLSVAGLASLPLPLVTGRIVDRIGGRPVVLAFYPADWSPVCGDQMALYNQVLPEFGRIRGLRVA